MALEDYHRKRHFGRTGEPAGRARQHPGRSFVVHKHAARRLHYDLRLEHDGVLLSWAVPKGPSLDPAEKRLAVQVEDHPVDYNDFEGLIPEGQYGAGPSALWDRGYWEPLGDVGKGLAQGKLHFRLHGERLAGGWHLVRAGGRKAAGKDWLLIKERDECADPARDLLAAAPDSVVSGRTLEEIAAEQSDAPAPTPTLRPAQLPQALKAALPETPGAQLATLVSSVPSGEHWLHEIKYDGYRMLCRISRGRAQLISRNGRDWSERFPALVRAAAALPVDEAVLDGEVVVLRPDGTTDFQALQTLLDGTPSGTLAYYLFDLPYWDGYDLSRTPLFERKAALRELLHGAPPALRYSDHVLGQGELIYTEACQRGLEGVISKRADSSYHASRSRSWTKTKCIKRAEFVIGGYTEPQGSRSGFGALLLGYYDEGKQLRYAGKVGTGFDERTLETLAQQLQRLETMKPAFAESPGPSIEREAHWVRPELVAEVRFGEWTKDQRLRHPAFVALRVDKPPEQVRRERERPPTPPPDRIAGVQISNPERVLWPELGLSKLELARFYADIAKAALPHLVERPLSLVRCPNGYTEQCFFQRHLAEARPRAIDTVVDGSGEEHLLIHDLEGLIALVQLGVLEIHPWGARAEQLERPDQMIFDLDPAPGVLWSTVCDAALEVRSRLEAMGLESYLKTTGGKGLHVVVPLAPRLDWEAHKAFAKALAERMERDAPQLYTANMSKSKREGRIFIDYLRNGRGATAVGAFSTRARPGAPVAVPLRWDELDGLAGADLYTARNLRNRLATLRRDPWEGFFESEQTVTAKMQRALDIAPIRRVRRRDV